MSNLGWTEFDILNANQLYVNGQPFTTYISNLVAEDNLEQVEIDEIKAFLARLDLQITAPNTLTITNDNRNSVLKTRLDTAASDITGISNRVATAETDIDNLETKLANINTSSLTETSTLNNDNRNSVLKTRLDTAGSDITGLSTRVATAETDIDNLEGKTRFVTQSDIIGAGATAEATLKVEVGTTTNQGKSKILIGYKNKLLPIIRSYFNTEDNTYELNNETFLEHTDGRMTVKGKIVRIQPHTTSGAIDIGDFSAHNPSPIKLGGLGSVINIGTEENNATDSATTITLGNRGTTRNSALTIRGNVFLGNARFEDLIKSQSFTWTQLASLIPTAGLPAYILSFALTSGIPNFVKSDLWSMKGSIQKDGDVETTNDAKLNSLVILNTDIATLVPRVTIFLANSDYSCTQLRGNHRTQVFEGQIVLRNNNILANDIDFLLTEANDKCNVVNIGGNEGILIHQGNSSQNEPLRILNTCSGDIRLLLGKEGKNSTANSGIRIRQYTGANTPILGDSQTIIGLYNPVFPNLNQDTSAMLFVAQTEETATTARDGIIVREKTTVNNITTSYTSTINGKSITTPQLNTNLLVASSIQGYNVKEITAGTNINVSNQSGNYTVENNAPVQNLIQGDGITISVNQSKTATISLAPQIGGGGSSSNDLAISEVGTKEPKPSYWCQNWSIADNTSVPNKDIYSSNSGQVFLTVNDTGIRFSTNYGISWQTSTPIQDNINHQWYSITGNAEGNVLYAIVYRLFPNLEFYIYRAFGNNLNTWSIFSQITQASQPTFIRVSADSKYFILNDSSLQQGGRILLSANYGASFTSINIGASIQGQTERFTMSASGQYQYVVFRNINAGISQIFKSSNFGQNWTLSLDNINNQVGVIFKNIDCDATGRFIYATRMLTGSQDFVPMYRSADYGLTWNVGNNGFKTIWVSATGQFVVGSSFKVGGSSNVFYSSNCGINFSSLSLQTNHTEAIAGSSDGNILAIASDSFTGNDTSDGKVRIARQAIQEVQQVLTTGLNESAMSVGFKASNDALEKPNRLETLSRESPSETR